MTRAPVKLSREMKMLLMLLLMVALVGLWYVWDSNRNAAGRVTGQTPAPQPTTQVPVAPTGNPGGTTTKSGKPGGSGGVAVQGGDQNSVQVTNIPPFPTGGTATNSTTATGPNSASGNTNAMPSTGDKPVTAGNGINPEGTLAGVPSNNPFRPLSLGAGGAAPTATSSTPPASTSNTTAITRPPAANTASTTTNNMTSVGPGGVNAIPGADGSSQVPSGASPINIPGADGSLGTTPVTATTPASGTLPTPSNVTSVRPIPVTPNTVTITPNTTNTPSNNANGSQASSGANNQNPSGNTPATSTPPTPAPVKPPIAGVSVPKVTTLPSGTAPAPATTPNTPGSPQASAPTTLPTPGNPQVITELGQADTGNTGNTQPTPNPLDQFVQDNQLAFNAVVLGPVNTAIFRGKDGFVVASTGQALPDSKVIVKEVTATSATLSLGNDVKTLELDKR